MQRVEIPGGYATIRDKVNVNGRQIVERTAPAALAGIRRVRKLREDQDIPLDDLTTPVEKARYTEAELDALQRCYKAGVVAFLKHWTLDEPIPTTIEEVGEMDPDVYEPIAAITGPMTFGAMKRVTVSVDDAFNDDGSPAMDSPTGPSTVSDDGEKASESTMSDPPTENSTSSSESTTTEVVTPA